MLRHISLAYVAHNYIVVGLPHVLQNVGVEIFCELQLRSIEAAFTCGNSEIDNHFSVHVVETSLHTFLHHNDPQPLFSSAPL